MDEPGGVPLSWAEFLAFCKHYRVRLGRLNSVASRFAYYGRVEEKDTGEVVCWLWHDEAIMHWVAFGPDNVTEEVEQLFERRRHG